MCRLRVGRIGVPSFLAGRVKTATERGARRNRDQGNSVLDVDGAWGHSPALPLDSLRRWDGRRGGRQRDRGLRRGRGNGMVAPTSPMWLTPEYFPRTRCAGGRGQSVGGG